ncbi:MAG: cupin domain-containing protein [Bacteroidia bacterium]|jgi:mannose-6-phosphate isomerase-like protein (cupin superfamily)
MPYRITDKPFLVPTTDGKLIEEHFGRASSRNTNFSLAHMVAPPGWSEPLQMPDFDEITIVIRGSKQFEIDGELVVLDAGKAILVEKGSKVRYSNPFDEEVEYWSVCIPAFSLDLAHRKG